jgi:hypothetical protein
MTSTHTSLAAARAPATLPLAALLQIPSTLLFKLAESVVALWATALHAATACAKSAALTPLGTVLGVEVDEVDVVEATAGALGADVELTTGVVAVEPLVVELLLLPQPATSAAQSSATASGKDRLAIIGPP